MVKNYEGFKEQLIKLVMLRSRNYVNTDCSIDTLIHVVFAEIATEVVLMWDIQSMIFSAGQTEYSLKTMDVFISPTTVKPGEPTEEYPDGANEWVDKFYDEVHDITDNEGNSLMGEFEIYEADSLLVMSPANLAGRDGSEFYVLRSVIPSIESIPPYMYQLMLKPMIEGIMFEIQDSVPSEVDGKLGNLQYQRFFNARKFLKEKLPQKNWITINQIGRHLKNGDL